MKTILVSDIMTRDPVTIKPDATLLECAQKMVRKRVGSLLIVHKKKLVGFVSQRDILWALIKKSQDHLHKIKAMDISAKKIAKISPFNTIEEAISKIKKLKFERLPVIHNGELIGMITIRDILNFKPEVYPEIEEFAQIKEETEKLKRVKQAEKRTVIRDGICEECGNRGVLHRYNGMLICESCSDTL